MKTGRARFLPFPVRRHGAGGFPARRRGRTFPCWRRTLVSSCRGTWSLVKKGGYYGISIVYSSGGSLTLYPGGEGAECLVMPVNPANPLEAVTFEKTF